MPGVTGPVPPEVYAWLAQQQQQQQQPDPYSDQNLPEPQTARWFPGGGPYHGPMNADVNPYAYPIMQANMAQGDTQQVADKQPTPPSIEDLIQQIYSQFGVNPGGAPEVPDLTGAVAGQFNPLIQHLQKGIKRTKREGANVDDQLAQIAHAGVANSRRETQRAIESGQQNTKAVNRQYNRSQERSSNQYDRETNSDMQKYLDMGMTAEDAAALANSGNKTQQKNENKSERDQNKAAASSRNQGQAYANWARQGAQISRLQGQADRADLATHVSDLVFASRGQIADTRAQKAAAMTAAIQQEYAMQADAYAQQQQAAMAEAQAALGMMTKAAGTTGSSSSSSSGTQLDPNKMSDSDYIASLLRNTRKQEGLPKGSAGQTLDTFMAQLPGLFSGNLDPQYQTPAPPDINQYRTGIQSLVQQGVISQEYANDLLSGDVFSRLFPSGAS